ncbi:hypothetical protein DUNSADRAFT_17065 [Dunaliella salina]|uniref:Encoded protein n=1 Tax=Dunaliella salina TaxID=3046 RepID=A0ABQ7H0J0_DUNSA|nr:hypothetical protein DUNSADRAFT_17065 [Dunaliella salina]|eukprot:KAF5840367.1 hypothetical protein DUNSADRAFT_17065 [Dunaliella salina]
MVSGFRVAIVSHKVLYVPLAALLLFTGLAYMFERMDLLAFYLPGTYLSWVYLRFFQLQPDSGGLYGDASDDFKFSSFFPDFLATPIDLLAGVVSVVTRLRHDGGMEGRAGHHHHHLAGMPSALGSDSADASRRRERGAKALEERLKGSHGAGHDLEGGKGVVVAAEATSS